MAFVHRIEPQMVTVEGVEVPRVLKSQISDNDGKFPEYLCQDSGKKDYYTRYAKREQGQGHQILRAITQPNWKYVPSLNPEDRQNEEQLKDKANYGHTVSSYSQSWHSALIFLQIVWPLSFLEQKTLQFTSSISLGQNIQILIVLILNFILSFSNEDVDAKRFDDIHWVIPKTKDGKQSVTGVVSLFSLLLMGSMNHPCILPLYENLENRSVPRFRKCMRVQTLNYLILFWGIAFVSYLTYGNEVSPNNVVESMRTLRLFDNAELEKQVKRQQEGKQKDIVGQQDQQDLEGNKITEENIKSFQHRYFVNGLPNGGAKVKWYYYLCQLGICWVVCSNFPLFLMPLVNPIRKKQVRQLVTHGLAIGPCFVGILVLLLGSGKIAASKTPNHQFGMANEIAGCCPQMLFLGLVPQQVCFQLLGYGKAGKVESNETVVEKLDDEEMAQLNQGVKPQLERGETNENFENNGEKNPLLEVSNSKEKDKSKNSSEETEQNSFRTAGAARFQTVQLWGLIFISSLQTVIGILLALDDYFEFLGLD